jgi:hypothetical protein
LKNPYKILAQVAWILLAVQLILALVFYLERISVLDASFVLLEIINTGQPIIMVGRYGSILTQSIPWIGVNMGWSLDTLMWAYSLSFPFLTLICATILYRIQQFDWIILLAAYFTFYYTDNFFWTNNEVHQAIPLFCLGAGILKSTPRKNSNALNGFFFLGLVVLCLSILTHPLVVILTAYYIGYQLLSGHWQLSHRREGIAIIVLLSCLCLKYYLSSLNWYDGNKIQTIWNFSWSKGGLWLDQPVWKAFWENIFYYLPAILWAVLSWGYALYHKKLLSVSFSLLAFLGHLALISIVVGEFVRFYTESQWMLLSFFILMPLFHKNLSYTPAIKKIIFSLIVFSLVFWAYRWTASIQHYSDRLQWHENQISWMEKEDLTKGLISELTDYESELLQMRWGLPAESLLLSSRKGNSRTYILKEKVTADASKSDFHNCFDLRPRDELNAKYFNLDTNQNYRSLPEYMRVYKDTELR